MLIVYSWSSLKLWEVTLLTSSPEYGKTTTGWSLVPCTQNSIIASSDHPSIPEETSTLLGLNIWYVNESDPPKQSSSLMYSKIPISSPKLLFGVYPPLITTYEGLDGSTVICIPSKFKSPFSGSWVILKHSLSNSASKSSSLVQKSS